MAYITPRNLEGFLPHLSKADTRHRLQVGADLLLFLANPANPVVCQDIGLLIDGFIPWMQSSNHKVSSNGIEIMTHLIDRLGTDFKPYLQSVLPCVIDRLGDAKDTVREHSQLLICKLLEKNVLTPQQLFEKLSPCFTHKNAKIREEVLRSLLNTVNGYGSQSLTLNKFIPDIVKLLSDPTSTVRDTAFSTLVDLYKHVGDRLRIDLQRRNLVPATKWAPLCARFDEIRDSNEILDKPTNCLDYLSHGDEVDRTPIKPTLPVKKPGLGSSVMKHRNQLMSANTNVNSVLSRVGSLRVKPSTASAASGGVDESAFIQSFEDVPKIQIFTAREVTENLNLIRETISDANKDWNKRMDALKKIRSLVIADAANYEEFFQGVRQCVFALQSTLKDPRSQVVREVCITIAYLAYTQGTKYEKSVEILLPNLINLIQNSAKVMATSALVALRFIIQYMHCSRFIPIIATNCMTSKSKDIRRSCCEFLDYILNNWPGHTLEKYVSVLQDAIKKGVADADPEARVSSRQAFRGFRALFPEHAEALLQSLDPNYRRILQGDISASSSNSNLASGYKSQRYFTRPIGAHESTTDSCKKNTRSNSAIDLPAAQRANARAQYAAMTRAKVTSGTASLPRPRKLNETPPHVLHHHDTHTIQSPERFGRSKNRRSQSQPTSRSGSPSSRLAYLYHQRTSDHDSPRPRRLSSGTPRTVVGSRETSRETSPSRTLGRIRRPGGYEYNRPPISPASRPVLAQKILQQSREAENALADVFLSNNVDHYRSARSKGNKSLDNHSDESETSSVCSERSFESFRRRSDDIGEIINLCASTVWQERKDGLLSLQHYLQSEIPLAADELKFLTEIFARMFVDSHTKGLSVFLDTLHEFISRYKHELHGWLYNLLQRVFLKLGGETLNSVHTKLLRTLELVRVTFPLPLLVSNVFRFLTNTTQKPNTKVKIIVLQFLTSLLVMANEPCGSGDQNSYEGEERIDWAQVSPSALQKIVTYSQDIKSHELRQNARQCLVALWNVNPRQMMIVLAELHKELQDCVLSVVQNHSRRLSSPTGGVVVCACGNGTESNGGCSARSNCCSKNSPSRHLVSPPNNANADFQEEIYRSLRKTSAEIQSYSYETKLIDRDHRDTTSQDSGISQMSLAFPYGGPTNVTGNSENYCQSTGLPGKNLDGPCGLSALEDKMDEMHITHRLFSTPPSTSAYQSSPNQCPHHTITAASSGARSLPIYQSNSTNNGDHSTSDATIIGNGNNHSDTANGFISLNEMNDSEIVKTVLEKCVIGTPLQLETKRQYLGLLIHLIKQGYTESIKADFRKLLRILIDYLNEKDSATQIVALDLLSAIFQSEDLKSSWEGFVELLTLRVLKAHSDENRDVVKAAEATAVAMREFPIPSVFKTLIPLIRTSSYPAILGAIKMTTKLIETHPDKITDKNLFDIMPVLVKCTDHNESAVRKSSIFCMVALYKAVGEERLAPHLTALPGSKMKLLKLYITRT